MLTEREIKVGYPFYSKDVSDIICTERNQAPTGDDPSGYLPDDGLVDAVNVALVLGRPLLLTGNPGTGKTQLAYSLAWQLATRGVLNVTTDAVEKFETKSTSQSKDLFYTFDVISRFHAAQCGGSTENADYISFNALGRAIINALTGDKVEGLPLPGAPGPGSRRSVVLIDEIDKAPRDFPNDLLNEIEEMYFRIPELKNRKVGGSDEIPRALRPIVVITSNSEKNLPAPFLRRCIYYHIPSPGEERLKEILLSRLPQLQSVRGRLVTEAARFFSRVQSEVVAQRQASPSELIQWLSFMLHLEAKPEGSLADARDHAFAGLGALAKDPEEQKKITDSLYDFLR